jgi:outer membrane protein assembly factor BamD
MSKYRRFYSLKVLLAGIVTLIGLSGCAALTKQYDETANWSAAQLYQEAIEERNDGNYKTAINYLEKLQARYPFGRYAQQAQLELIYVNYKDNEPDAAIAAADRFIKTNPRHPFVDYAYYMKGLVNFSRSGGPLDRFLPNAADETDTTIARQSYNDFAELVQKFPTSKYAQDARQRMVFLHNNLAAYEVNVADFYLHQGAYLAAANRAKYVIENYSRTPAIPNALAIMAQAYLKLGLNDLAADATRVLKLNHPDSPYIPKLNTLLENKEKASSFSPFRLSS